MQDKREKARRRSRADRRKRFLFGLIGGMAAALAIALAVIVGVLVSPAGDGLKVRDDGPRVQRPANTAVPTAAPTATPEPAQAATQTPESAEPTPTPAAPTAVPISAGELLFGSRSVKAPTKIIVATPVPTQTPLPSNQPYVVLSGVNNTDHALGAGERMRVLDNEFDMTIFLGDDLTEDLGNYVQQARFDNELLLGSAKFLSVSGLTAAASLEEVSPVSAHITYAGEKMAFETLLSRVGASRVILMLGYNDLKAGRSPDQAVADVLELVRRIQAASPEIRVVVQSVPPRMADSPGQPDNDAIFAYDLTLYEACAAGGIPFADTAYALRNDDGSLPGAWCADPQGERMRLTSVGCQVWLDFLYTHLP